MKLEVQWDTYGENCYLTIDQQILCPPSLLKKVLDVLERFPSQALAYQRAVQADFARGKFVFGHATPTDGYWKPFLTLSFAKALAIPVEELDRRVEEAANNSAK